MGNTCSTIQSGPWNVGSTWQDNVIPQDGNDDSITIGHTITAGVPATFNCVALGVYNTNFAASGAWTITTLDVAVSGVTLGNNTVIDTLNLHEGATVNLGTDVTITSLTTMTGGNVAYDPVCVCLARATISGISQDGYSRLALTVGDDSILPNIPLQGTFVIGANCTAGNITGPATIYDSYSGSLTAGAGFECGEIAFSSISNNGVSLAFADLTCNGITLIAQNSGSMWPPNLSLTASSILTSNAIAVTGAGGAGTSDGADAAINVSGAINFTADATNKSITVTGGNGVNAEYGTAGGGDATVSCAASNLFTIGTVTSSRTAISTGGVAGAPAGGNAGGTAGTAWLSLGTTSNSVVGRIEASNNGYVGGNFASTVQIVNNGTMIGFALGNGVTVTLQGVATIANMNLGSNVTVRLDKGTELTTYNLTGSNCKVVFADNSATMKVGTNLNAVRIPVSARTF